MNLMRASRSLSLVVLLLLSGGARLQAWHPFHISTVEIEFNAQTGRFEIGVKVQAGDLEKALSQTERRRVHLDQEAKLDVMLLAYVRDRLYFANALPAAPATDETSNTKSAGTSVPKPIELKSSFVGKEFENSWLWIFVEMDAPHSTKADLTGGQPLHESPKLVLVNRLLMEVNDQQINTVTFRKAGQRHSIQTTEGKVWREVDASWWQTTDAAVGPVSSK